MDQRSYNFKATVKHYTALKAEGRRGRKLIDRPLSSDYDRCSVKQVEPALSCSYLTYIHSRSLVNQGVNLKLVMLDLLRSGVGSYISRDKGG